MELDLTLLDMGERNIIRDILSPRYNFNIGDDCAFLNIEEIASGGVIVCSTDPCPIPMFHLLGNKDMYYWGWLLATINLSDIAASGAKPLGLLTSLILPKDTSVSQFNRLLDGIDDCCKIVDTHVIGGNIKESEDINLSATAIGIGQESQLLRRSGCQVEDKIIVLGNIGMFWAGVLAIKYELILDEDEKSKVIKCVSKPVPKVEIGRAISENGLVTACLDNSDGLYASLIELSNINKLQMNINMDNLDLPSEVLKVCHQLDDLDPIRLCFGWGDWQLIVCCAPNKLEELRELSKSYGVPFNEIGEVGPGNGVILEHEGKQGNMAAIDSQRFTKDSWFTTGLDSYEELLLKGSLWKK